MAFDVFTMPNGMRVVGEYMPNARSAAVGLYIGIGSQYESQTLNGISHFMEHMVFKGTRNRSALQIATEMDRIGGQINAYTARECTCFYTRTLPRYLAEAIDVIFDLALNPALDPQEMEKEKGVVIEEIAMAEDDPEDLAHELLMRAHFGRKRVARPILGTERNVSRFTRDDLLKFHSDSYRPDNAVFSIAGNYDRGAVEEMLKAACAHWSGTAKKPRGETIVSLYGAEAKNRALEQTHVCLGFDGLPLRDARNYELTVISSVYGGAMSSRLFQRIREELGLAYSVYSELGDYTDCGMLSVYAAVSPDRVGQLYRELIGVTKDFAEKGMTKEEFERTREQVTAELILSGESISSHMQANGRRMLLMNETKTEDQLLEKLNAVTLESVNTLLKATLTGRHSMAIVGKGAKAELSAING